VGFQLILILLFAIGHSHNRYNLPSLTNQIPKSGHGSLQSGVYLWEESEPTKNGYHQRDAGDGYRTITPIPPAMCLLGW
jgi:hypothetical protein